MGWRVVREGAGLTLRVAVLTVALAAMGVCAAFLPRPAALATLPLLPWWLLAGLFAVAEVAVVRREPRTVSLVEIPLVVGLFLARPGDLIIARLVGTAAVFLLLRRQPLLKAAFNVALFLGGSATALAVFVLTVTPGEALRARTWLAAMFACGAAGVLEGVSLACVLGWSGDPVSLRDAARETGSSVLVSGLAAAAGVITVPVLVTGGFAVPLLVTGAAALVGYRAYAALALRYAQLDRLHRLSGRLATATTTALVTQHVVEETADLVRAGYVELVLDAGRGMGLQRWSLRDGSPVTGPQPYQDPLPAVGPEGGVVGGRDEEAVPAPRQVNEALVVWLHVDEQIPGFLLVADRAGKERGFRDRDLRLLQTVADQSTVALRGARLVDRLHYEARHDELTGLPNRLTFREKLEAAALAAAEGRHPAAVMLLDVDGFKAVNDTLGHHAGDELLQELARRMGEAAGDEALVARLGGDEFAMLWPGPDREPPDGMAAGRARSEALALADRLLACFDEPVALAGTRVRLGGSIGVALGPEHGGTATDLLRNADIAMYAVKSAGGGVREFSWDLADGDASTVTLAGDLRDAIAAGAIELEVQPVVDLSSGAVHSVEALARWHHPELGDVPPETFFAAAERSGQSAELAALVLDRALGLCRDWNAQGRPVRVAVNLASRRLADSSLPQRVASALQRHGVPARLLCLEITEAAVIAEPEQTLEVLNRLRQMGIQLSVDDFGTGYSSLTVLARLPVHQLKISQSFVARLGDSPKDLAVVRSVLDLGRHLGLDVVAEGIGDETARRTLMDLGCRLGQGYRFAAPMPTAELPGYLDRNSPGPRPPRQRLAASGPAPSTGRVPSSGARTDPGPGDARPPVLA
ncbi:MAG TPA: EAL domain-containing protein [Kineosporiaceae bacterium]|nr:EAL domain-containing protein [Kineosporiaceae bacterium]